MSTAAGRRAAPALRDDDPAVLDPDLPTAHQAAGGAPRSFGVLVAVLALAAAAASAELVLAEMRFLADPDAALSCDLNPLVGCGQFLTTWQAHALLGIPNAVVGLPAYAALAAVGTVLSSGARLPRWFWRVLVAGVWASGVAVLWFMGVSFGVVHGLCPFCLVVWLVTVPLLTQTTARAIQGGHVSLGRWLDGVLVRERWVLTVAAYLALTVAIALAYWDSWALLLVGALR